MDFKKEYLIYKKKYYLLQFLAKQQIGGNRLLYDAFTEPTSDLQDDSVFGDHSTIKVNIDGKPLLFITCAELLHNNKGFENLKKDGKQLFNNVNLKFINKLDNELKQISVDCINMFAPEPPEPPEPGDETTDQDDTNPLLIEPLDTTDQFIFTKKITSSDLLNLHKDEEFIYGPKFNPSQLKGEDTAPEKKRETIKRFFIYVRNKFLEKITQKIKDYKEPISRGSLLWKAVYGSVRSNEWKENCNTIPLLEAIRDNITSNDIDKLMTMDADTSPIFNSKNGMFKMVGETTNGRSYYLLQIFGALINTQPFGGFNLTKDLADRYKTRDNFINEISRLSNTYELYGVDGTKEVNKALLELNPETPLIQDDNNEADSYAVHGKSTGGDEVFTAIGKILKTKNFCFSDTNNTKSKMGNKMESSILEYHKTKLIECGNLPPGKYYLVMSQIHITKSRTGGPIFNTQIYKSEPNPVTERDGMIGVFKDSIPEIEPHLEMIEFEIKI